MDAFVFFLVVVLILVIGVAISVRLHALDDVPGTSRIRRIRRLRTVHAAPGAVGTVPVNTMIEEIIDEIVPEPEEEV